MPHIGFIIFRRLRPFCPEGAGVGASTDRALMAFCLLVYMLLLLLVSGALERNNKHGVPRCWLLLPPPLPPHVLLVASGRELHLALAHVSSRVLVSGPRRGRSASGSPPALAPSGPSWCEVALGSPGCLAAILLCLC